MLNFNKKQEKGQAFMPHVGFEPEKEKKGRNLHGFFENATRQGKHVKESLAFLYMEKFRWFNAKAKLG